MGLLPFNTNPAEDAPTAGELRCAALTLYRLIPRNPEISEFAQLLLNIADSLESLERSIFDSILPAEIGDRLNTIASHMSALEKTIKAHHKETPLQVIAEKMQQLALDLKSKG